MAGDFMWCRWWDLGGWELAWATTSKQVDNQLAKPMHEQRTLGATSSEFLITDQREVRLRHLRHHLPPAASSTLGEHWRSSAGSEHDRQ
ncbi:hypothetical protein Dimus_004814 [Dionaea muscipula]